MSDLVERLRNRNTPYGWLELADKAADEIERLRDINAKQCSNIAFLDAEIERLRDEIESWVAQAQKAREEVERLQAENKELRAKIDKANEPLWPRTEL